MPVVFAEATLVDELPPLRGAPITVVDLDRHASATLSVEVEAESPVVGRVQIVAAFPCVFLDPHLGSGPVRGPQLDGAAMPLDPLASMTNPLYWAWSCHRSPVSMDGCAAADAGTAAPVRDRDTAKIAPHLQEGG